MSAATSPPRFKRPAVLDALPRTGHAVVEASAGTGKTYAIEHLWIEHLLGPEALRQDPETIDDPVFRAAPLDGLLVVTFTERATAELRQRIGQLLGRLASTAQTSTAQTSAVQTRTAQTSAADGSEHAHADSPRAHWHLHPVVAERVQAALARFEHAPIHTIHGFCRRLLTGFPIEVGLPLRWQAVDGAARLKAAIQDLIDAPTTGAPETSEREAAIEAWYAAGHDPIALARLLSQAWHHRGAGQLGATAEAGLLRTLTALLDCGDLLTDLAGTAINQPSLAAADRTARALHAALNAPDPIAAVAELDLSPLRRPHRTASRDQRRFPEDLSARSLAVLAELDALDALRAGAATLEARVVSACLPALRHRLDTARQAGELDYDDLLDTLAEALEGPAWADLARAARARYRVALIDEFQDTDDRQWQIFRRLFLDVLPDECPASEHTRLILIGDPKQAIYGFRGANVHTWLAACAHLEAAGAPRVVLAENHRATPELVQALNLIFDPQAAEPLFTGAIRPAGPAVAAQNRWTLSDATGAAAPPVTLLAFDPPAPRAGGGDRTHLPKYVLQPTFARAQALALADVLAPHRGFTLDDPTTGPRPVRPADVWVLVRDQFDALDAVAALTAAGLRAVHDRRHDPAQSEAADHLHAVLVALSEHTSAPATHTATADPAANPQRIAHRRRAQATPFCPATRAQALDLIEISTHPVFCDGAWFEALLPLASRPPRLLTALSQAPDLRAWARLGGAENWLADLDRLVAALCEAHLTHGYDLARLAATLRPDALCTVPALEVPDEATELSDDAPIRVMTIHKSKGLQAPIIAVFGGFGQGRADVVRVLPGPVPRLLVGAAAQAAVADALRRADAEEDQRLLYVALTRARSRVILPLIQSRRAVQGSIAALNLRLRSLEADGLDPALFEVRKVSDAVSAPPPPAPGPSLDDWRPAAPLEIAIPAPLPTAPFVQTSYSQLAHAEPAALQRLGLRPWSLPKVTLGDVSDQAAENVYQHIEDDTPPKPGLPGGPEVGTALHACIEALLSPGAPAWPEAAGKAWPADGATDTRPPRAVELRRWTQAATAWLSPLWAAHRLAPEHLPEAVALLAHTLAQPLVLPPAAPAPHADGYAPPLPEPALAGVAEGDEPVPCADPAAPQATPWPPLCRLRARHIEAPFTLPLPTANHPRLADLLAQSTEHPSRGSWHSEHGFINGFIDLLVEHEGRWYFVDWKSDRLPAYDAASLDAHVRVRYGVQVALYSLALARAVAVDGGDPLARFGGGIYVFLRGLAEPVSAPDAPSPAATPGLWCTRPTADDLARWTCWLAGQPPNDD